MFFDDWFGLFRILMVGVLAYAAIIFWLRLSGKRTLSKWNAFDFIVTVALGSTLATVVMSEDVVLFEGVAALGLLVGLQFAITFLAVRFDWLKKIVNSEPALLLEKGEFLRGRMRGERVTESEIRMAIRAEGIGGTEEVEAVVLETDGSFSVIKKNAAGSRSALSDGS
jgi:uncharacterized membrane protein YcaP (DUF421 family)